MQSFLFIVIAVIVVDLGCWSPTTILCIVTRHLPTRTHDIPTLFELCWQLSRLSSLYQQFLTTPVTLC